MPSHTFTRLGQWDESIAWNLRAAEASRAQPVAGRISLHYLHALDYLAYAYLQTGRDSAAEAVAATIAGLSGPFVEEIATPYSLAAVPARLALERRRWGNAAALVPRTPSGFPWERFPATESLTHFARALGTAHVGDLPLARQCIRSLERLRQAASPSSEYWADQIQIQAISARAWLAWAEGDSAQALLVMHQAAAREAATEKRPVTPGEVLPARELLGDMLLAAGRPQRPGNSTRERCEGVPAA